MWGVCVCVCDRERESYRCKCVNVLEHLVNLMSGGKPCGNKWKRINRLSGRQHWRGWGGSRVGGGWGQVRGIGLRGGNKSWRRRQRRRRRRIRSLYPAPQLSHTFWHTRARSHARTHSHALTPSRTHTHTHIACSQSNVEEDSVWKVKLIRTFERQGTPTTTKNNFLHFSQKK